MFTTYEEAQEAFNETIREVTGDVEVLGYTFDPASILYNTDPVAYREEFYSFIDNLGVDADDLEGDLNDF